MLIDPGNRLACLQSIDNCRQELAGTVRDRLRGATTHVGIDIPSSPPAILIDAEPIDSSTGALSLASAFDEVADALAISRLAIGSDPVETRGDAVQYLRQAARLSGTLAGLVGDGSIDINPRFLGSPIYSQGLTGNLWADQYGAPALPTLVLNWAAGILQIPGLPGVPLPLVKADLARLARALDAVERWIELLDDATLALELLPDTDLPDDPPQPPTEDCGPVIEALTRVANEISLAASQRAACLADVPAARSRSTPWPRLAIRYARAGQTKTQRTITLAYPKPALTVADLPAYNAGAAAQIRLAWADWDCSLSVDGDAAALGAAIADLCDPRPIVYVTTPSPVPAAQALWQPRGGTIMSRDGEGDVVVETYLPG